MDLGMKKEKMLFRVFTGLGTIVSLVLIIIYFTRDY
jgi:hypothetical protein